MNLSKQNILFFTRTMGLGGTENVVLQLCETLKPFVNKIVVCSCSGIHVEKLNFMGIQHYSIPDIESKSPKTIFKVSRILKDVIKKEHITVIHTHHRMAAFYITILGLYKLCFFINTSHNTFNDKRFLTRFAYKKASLIACGEMVKKNLIDEYGFTNITVIYNAVKPFDGVINLYEELVKAKQEGKFLVGNIGRLSKQKGMEYYIRAISLVIERHPRVHFYIIGSGEDEEKLKIMSRGLPITFMGYCEDIQNLMSQLDLIVLSSLWEGLPLTPIEAFSVGKTIVATGVDGTLEIVKDGKNGLLVEPQDYKQIAEKICWMIEHPEERMQMEKNAKETFDNVFSFNKFKKSYIDFYERL